jgi:magnesium chelatase family protein
MPQLKRHAALGEAERLLLERAADRLQLSARACHRILRVARTIADLDQADTLAATHLAEAISYRSLDR